MLKLPIISLRFSWLFWVSATSFLSFCRHLASRTQLGSQVTMTLLRLPEEHQNEGMLAAKWHLRGVSQHSICSPTTGLSAWCCSISSPCFFFLFESVVQIVYLPQKVPMVLFTLYKSVKIFEFVDKIIWFGNSNECRNAEFFVWYYFEFWVLAIMTNHLTRSNTEHFSFFCL